VPNPAGEGAVAALGEESRLDDCPVTPVHKNFARLAVREVVVADPHQIVAAVEMRLGVAHASRIC
jgi:hypothetical protein